MTPELPVSVMANRPPNVGGLGATVTPVIGELLFWPVSTTVSEKLFVSSGVPMSGRPRKIFTAWVCATAVSARARR